MKLNTIEKLYDCMVNRQPRIDLDPVVLEKARKPIERMLEISARPTSP
jgi:quinolinate synthase